MDSSRPPPLHRRKFTLELTNRLGSLKDLLAGIEDLLKFDHQDDCELQRHGRKIIALTEVARLTLRREGVKLYLRREHAFPSELNDRITRLLLPLDPHFVIRIGGVDPRAQLGIEELLVPSPVARRIKSPAVSVLSASQSDAMPPPDFFVNRKARIDRLGEFIKNSMKKKSPAPKRLVPKQYPAGHLIRPGDQGGPSRPPRLFARAPTQNFGISFTAK